MGTPARYEVLEYVLPRLWDASDLPITKSVWLIDNRPAALGLYLVGLIGLIILAARPARGTRLFFAAAALGSFSWSYGLADEVFINLVHPLNVLLHGRFSFSPNINLDGTVEPIFYGLHVLGLGRNGIIAFNFWFCYALFVACGLLTLNLIRRMVPLDPARATLTLAAFASFPSVVFSVSTGFGNVWLLFLILGGLGGVMAQSTPPVIATSALLALSRPEGIAFAGLLVTAAFVARARWRGPLIAAIVGAVGYFVFYRFYFGHWIPTPLFFKRLPDECWAEGGPLKTAWALLRRGFALFYYYEHDETFFVDQFFRRHHWPLAHRLIWPTLVASTLVAALRTMIFERRAPADRARLVIALTLLASLLSCILYTAPPGAQGGLSRYFLSSQGLVFIFAAAECWRGGGRFVRQWFRILIAASALTLPFTSKSRVVFNRNFDAHVGEFLRDLPAAVRVSTSELDTLGYYADRDVGDLWGYVNTDISNSRLYYRGALFANPGKKINPAAFAHLRSDLSLSYVSGATSFCANCPDEITFGAREFAAGRDDLRGDQTRRFRFPTDRMDLVRAFAEPYYRGETASLLAEYDVVFAHDDQRMVAFLARRDQAAVVEAWLRTKGGSLKSRVALNEAPRDQVSDVADDHPTCRDYLKFPARRDRPF